MFAQYFPKSPPWKGHLSHLKETFAKLGRFYAIFAIFAKFAKIAKIATPKGAPLSPVYTTENFRHGSCEIGTGA